VGKEEVISYPLVIMSKGLPRRLRFVHRVSIVSPCYQGYARLHGQIAHWAWYITICHAQTVNNAPACKRISRIFSCYLHHNWTGGQC
jgi:hypothetical protein